MSYTSSFSMDCMLLKKLPSKTNLIKKTHFGGGLVWEQMGEPLKDWPQLTFLAFKDQIFLKDQISYFIKPMFKI